MFDFSKQQVTVFCSCDPSSNAGFANSTLGNMRVLFVTNRFDRIKLRHKSSIHAWCKGARPMFAMGKRNLKLSIQVKFKEIAGNKPTICICFHVTVGGENMCKLFLLTVHLF